MAVTTAEQGAVLYSVQVAEVAEVMDMLHLLGALATQAAFGGRIPQEAVVLAETLMVGLETIMLLDAGMAEAGVMVVAGQLTEEMEEQEVFLAAVVVLAVVLTMTRLRLAQAAQEEKAKSGFGRIR